MKTQRRSSTAPQGSARPNASSKAGQDCRQSTPKARANQSRAERVGEYFARDQELLLFGLKSLCGLKIPLH